MMPGRFCWIAVLFITVLLLSCRGNVSTARQTTGTVPPGPRPSVSYEKASQACAQIPLRETGKIYYACDCQKGEAHPDCQAGDDKNDCTDRAKPCRTFKKMLDLFNSDRFNAGDTIAFCQGGIFIQDAEGIWLNKKCRTAKPNSTNTSGHCEFSDSDCDYSQTCDIRDYDPWQGKTPPATVPNRPMIWSSNATGYSATFRVFEGGTPEGQRQPHYEGYRIFNLSLKTEGNLQNLEPELPGPYRTSWAVVASNNTTDIKACNIVCDGYGLCGYASSEYSKGLGGADGFTLQGSMILNSYGSGFFGSGSGACILDNYFYNNGTCPPGVNSTLSHCGSNREHSIYVGGESGELDNQGNHQPPPMILSGNEIYRSAHASGGTDDGKCVGSPIVVHGGHTGLIIENNLIQEKLGEANGGCWGIEVDTGYWKDERFRHTLIRRNRVLNVGGAGIYVSQCQDCLIENNLVAIQEGGTGIQIADRAGHPSADRNTATVVRNNTVYFGSGSTGIQITNSTYTCGPEDRDACIADEGTGYVIANNAIYASSSQYWTCLDLRRPLSAYSFIDHNLCWYPSVQNGAWVRDGKSEFTLSAWQTHTAANAFDVHSLQADPLFVNPVAASESDFTPQKDSRLVNTGTQAQTCTVLGLPNQPCFSIHTLSDDQQRDDRPDIGAYEYREP